MSPETDNLGIFQPFIGSWYECLKNPREFQEQVLSDLVGKYVKTRYGQNHSADEVKDVASFRTNFPIVNCKMLSPYFAEVMKGDYAAILPEPLECWVMTRGSTGPAKVIPVTRTHLELIFTCGARALINYVLRKNDYEIFSGKIFNLNLPSVVHKAKVDGRDMTYGYSSGTYARLNPAFGSLSLLPKQESIDALGSGITRRDWERRFELAYEQAFGENVAAVMGVTPVILSFAKYVKKKHGKLPKELWKMHALFCTSVRKIQFRYGLVLKKYFGDVPVVEIYSATEGVFAQQLDDLPYVTPNYDKYFFEVVTGQGTKMLHELERGEWGRLIISSCLFPRYDIGDMVEAAGKGYFRVFGRRNVQTLLEHSLYRLFFRTFL